MCGDLHHHLTIWHRGFLLTRLLFRDREEISWQNGVNLEPDACNISSCRQGGGSKWGEPLLSNMLRMVGAVHRKRSLKQLQSWVAFCV